MQHLTSADSGAVVNLLYGDGQSVIGLKNLKKRWPALYANVLVGVGGFHEHAHSMFAFTEMFNHCFFRYA